jgi:hypothetical protein
MFFFFFFKPSETSKKDLPKIDRSSPEALINSFCSGAFSEFRNDFFYRGEGNNENLVPSILREKNYRSISLTSIASTNPTKSKDIHLDQFLFDERSLLQRFYFESNQAGLSLPYSKMFVEADPPSGFSSEKGPYIHSLAPLMALGDHYGLHTRMLDFSFDPLVALYFACSHLREGLDDKTPIKLYFLRKNFFSYNSRARCVVPEYAHNANLRAQQGALVYWALSPGECFLGNEVSDPNSLITTFSLNDFPNISTDYLVSASIKRTWAPKILTILSRMGYTKASLFPNYSDIISYLQS